MISVPARVKDALRDGRLLKNHKIVVLDPIEHKSAVSMGTLQDGQQAMMITQAGYYVLYNETTPEAFDYVEINNQDAYPCPTGGDATWFQIPKYLNVNDSIYINRFNADYVNVTLVDNVTTYTEWVEDFTMDNDTLVYESVKYDERMCSGDILKFGLCEGSSLEFQYFNHPNINGRRIQCFIDVQYMEKSTELTRTNAVFTVLEAGSYQAFVPAGSPSFEIEIWTGEYPGPAIEVPASNLDETIPINNLQEGTKLIINSSNAVTVTISKSDQSLYPMWYTIPMGFFTVSKCSRQASTGIQKVTAYNKLMSSYLDANANALIEEAISEGEQGKPADTISLRTLLDRLLNDYYIDREPDIEVPITLTDGTPYAVCYTRLDSTHAGNGYLRMAILGKVLHIPDFDQTAYYKIKIDCKAIDSYIEQLRHNMIRDAQGNLYKYTPQNLPSGYYANGYTYYEINNSDYAESVRFWYVNGNTIHQEMFSILANRDVDTYESEWLTDFTNMELFLPLVYTQPSSYDNTINSWDRARMSEVFADIESFLLEHIKVYKRDASEVEKMNITLTEAKSWGQVTLRDLQSATFEINCQFGQIDRNSDLFSGVELNQALLYPADSLYPANDLYPGGVSETSFRSWYSKLWTDTVGEQSFRKLIITYKGLDENNVPMDFTMERTVNVYGTTDYIMSDNWLFKNLIWDSEDVRDYADAMITKMQSIKWFPFEMWAAGLPYIETGDMIEIIVGDETHRSYILQRQLSGIQNLQDTYINGTLDIF